MPIDAKDPVGSTMSEFKSGNLHSGKRGPVVKSRKQAIAIGLSEKRRIDKSPKPKRIGSAGIGRGSSGR